MKKIVRFVRRMLGIRRAYEPPTVTFIKWWDENGVSHDAYGTSWFTTDMATRHGAQAYLDSLPCSRGYVKRETWGYAEGEE